MSIKEKFAKTTKDLPENIEKQLNDIEKNEKLSISIIQKKSNQYDDTISNKNYVNLFSDNWLEVISFLEKSEIFLLSYFCSMCEHGNIISKQIMSYKNFSTYLENKKMKIDKSRYSKILKSFKQKKIIIELIYTDEKGKQLNIFLVNPMIFLKGSIKKLTQLKKDFLLHACVNVEMKDINGRKISLIPTLNVTKIKNVNILIKNMEEKISKKQNEIINEYQMKKDNDIGNSKEDILIKNNENIPNTVFSDFYANHPDF